jgi:uncharacterized protein (TIGR02145 family)
MYSGGWATGSFYSQSTSGYYWSSTVYNTTNARYLSFTTTNVTPANYTGGKRLGYAVRCVAP